jgi:uncharacterized protein YecT (DUF1311 family)
MRITLIAAALVFFTSFSLCAQTLEQQFEAADAELNRVYKELRSKLNDEQKAELTRVQKVWLAEVQNMANQNRAPQQYLTPNEQRQQFLVQATQQRTYALRKLFEQIVGISMEEHALRIADERLNNVYRELRAKLGDIEKKALRDVQLQWLDGRNQLDSPAEQARMTAWRTAELAERLKSIESGVDGDSTWLEASSAEEAKYAAAFGLRPVYQSCPYDAENVVAEANNGKYRAMSVSDSNKIYLFDMRSRLLLGECDIEGAVFEGVAGSIQFTSCGRFIMTSKDGYKGGDFNLVHVPSLMRVLQLNSYMELTRGPLAASGGYVGLAMSRDSRLHEANDFLFESALSQIRYGASQGREVSGRQFLEAFPHLASRVGSFFLPLDAPFNIASDADIRFVADVVSSEGEKSVQRTIDIETWHTQRARWQIEDISVRGHEFALLERKKDQFRYLVLDLHHLRMTDGGRAMASTVLNPTVFGDDLNLYYADLPTKQLTQRLGVMTCEIDQRSRGATANLVIDAGGEKVAVPPHGKVYDHEMFQMARYYDGPSPLIAAYWVTYNKVSNDYGFGLYSTSSKKWIYQANNNRPGKYFSEAIRHWRDPVSGNVWVSASNVIKQLRPLDGTAIKELSCDQSFEVFAIDNAFLVGLPRMDEPRIEVWSMNPFSKVCDILWDDDLNLSIFCPDGLYSTSSKSVKRMAIRSYDRVYPFEQFDLRLNRPDIVLERLGAPAEAVNIAKQLREKRLKRMGVTEEMLKPDFHVPELEIVGNIPGTTDGNEINVSIKASDSKYPLERLKVFVNNVPVNGRDGESLRDQNTPTFERAIPIKLAAGRNKIQVSVLNSAGAESLYANAEVNCTANRPKPALYAVALGVSDYANPEWNLQYAAKDAKDVLERLKTKSGGSYSEVKELLMTDKDVTKESLGQIRDFLKDATIDDTVLMFVAGHGLLDSQYDYYFGTTDIDFNNPAEKGIAFEEFDDLLAALPCLKKSLLIDTCHAGELDEEEKTLLASAGGTTAPLPTGNGIAMRSIGTRGMNVKAIEGARGASEWYDRLQGLFVDLRRGSGSTILSSSAGAEYALESSEQQNGLFTYAVLEALDGKKDADTNNDGAVQMSELGEYVKKRVAELTNNKQTPNTRRVNLEGDFTLAKTE